MMCRRVPSGLFRRSSGPSRCSSVQSCQCCDGRGACSGICIDPAERPRCSHTAPLHSTPTAPTCSHRLRPVPHQWSRLAPKRPSFRCFSLCQMPVRGIVTTQRRWLGATAARPALSETTHRDISDSAHNAPPRPACWQSASRTVGTSPHTMDDTTALLSPTSATPGQGLHRTVFSHTSPHKYVTIPSRSPVPHAIMSCVVRVSIRCGCGAPSGNGCRYLGLPAVVTCLQPR